MATNKYNRYERKIRYKNHLMLLYSYKKEKWYPSIVVKEDDYYKKVYRSKNSSYLKKISNKKIRKFKGTIPKGHYFIHKIYDYWYELY